MNEQRTPDTLTMYQNELICEKLLGWTKTPWFDGWAGNWTMQDGVVYAGTPSFTTWADAGLILDWLMSHIGPGLTRMRDGLALDLRGRTLTPAIVRAAALEYIKATQATDLIMARGDGG